MSESETVDANPGNWPDADDALCRHVLNEARDAVLVIDAAGQICEVNAAAESMYGYSRAELVGMPLVRLRARDQLDSLAPQLAAARDRGLLFETRHVRKDGSALDVEVSSRGVTLAGGHALVSIVRDVSGRREQEAERERLLAELAEANRRLDSLVRITSGALGWLEGEDALSRTLELLLAETGADAALLLEKDGESMVVRQELGSERRPLLGERFDAGEGFAGRVAAAGSPLYVADVLDSAFALPIHTEVGFRSMFGVPVFLAGELFAVLELAWFEQHPISEDGIRLVLAAADRIVLAAANARLYARAKRAQALSATLNDVNSLVNSSFDLSQTMEAALTACAEALSCDAAMLAVVEAGAWRPRFAFGMPAAVLDLSFEHESAIRGLSGVVSPEPQGVVGSWIEANLGVRESLVAPLAVRGRQVGLVLFGRFEPAGGFDDLTCDFAARFADAIALAVANVDDFLAEHRIAETLQEALLTTPSSVRGIEFGHLYRSSTVRTRVGGDFYDIFELAYGRVGVVVGDVSGKGLEAAVLTSVVKDTIRAFAHDMTSPAEVVARANIALGRAAKLPEFASVFFGVIDTRTASMTYCCAGHPPAIVIAEDGCVSVLESTSPVIGAFEDLSYEERVTHLAPGDRVLLYTDGVTEARAANGAFFGEEGLLSMLRCPGSVSVEELPTFVFDEVMRFTLGRLSDDIALLAFRLV